MELYQEELAKAKKHLKIADHMLQVTLPLVKESKLLMVILENIFLSLSTGMSAILHYERYCKRIPPYGEGFEAKFHVFRTKIQDRYHFDKEQLLLIRNIKEVVVEHKKSPVEFAKEDKFVICSSAYEMNTLTIPQMKEYIAKTKLFIQELEYILVKNERISH